MSIVFPPAAAGFRRRMTALIAGLPLLVIATCLGGCGQRMAVKVNGESVSQDQFYHQCADFNQNQGISAPTAGLYTINLLIRQVLVTQEAKRLNLQPTDGEVDAELANLRKQLTANGQSLDQHLQQIGLPLQALKDEIRLGLTQKKLMTQGVTVTDKEIEQYYNQNKQGQFTTPEQVQAEQITVPSEAAAKEVKQTLDKNADFRLVAHTKSIDQYKDQGGTLPVIQRGFPTPPGVSPDVASEALKTPEGKVAGPLKVGNTWIILKVVSRKPQSSKTLAEVKDEIQQQLLMQKAQQGGQMAKFQQRMVELQRDADIQVGIDQYKQPIMDQQKMFKQAPTPGLVPTPPAGR
jgi:foldase protein PrsA